MLKRSALVLLLAATSAHAHTGGIPLKTVTAKLAMRDLWLDQAFWLRNQVIAAAVQDKALQAEAAKQSEANAEKLSVALEKTYGKERSPEVLRLLKDHLGAARDYVEASWPAPNPEKQKAARERLNAGAKAIAAFLSDGGPKISKQALEGVLTGHVADLTKEIDLIQKKDYAGEAKAWESMKQHLFTLSDALVPAAN